VIKGLTLNTDHYPSINFIDTEDVSIEDLTLNDTKEKLISVQGKNSKNISIEYNSKAKHDEILQVDDLADNASIQISGSKAE